MKDGTRMSGKESICGVIVRAGNWFKISGVSGVVAVEGDIAGGLGFAQLLGERSARRKTCGF
jgi:hypothetical protein